MQKNISPLSIKKLWNDKLFRTIIILFIISKVMIFGAGLLGSALLPESSAIRHVYDNTFYNSWSQFDSSAYVDIATNGYRLDFEGTGTYTWFPLLPALMYILGFIMPIPITGLLIANIASFFAIALLYYLVKEEFGEKTGFRSVVYLMFFPTAYFLAAIYTESLYLFFALLAFYYAKQQKWLAASISGFFLAASRLTGVLIAIPLAYMYMRDRKWDFARIKADVLAFCLIPLGLLSFVLYISTKTGSLLTIFTRHTYWNKHVTWPWVSIIAEFKLFYSSLAIGNTLFTFYHLFYILLTLAFIVLLIYSFKVTNIEYALFFLLNYLIPLIGARLEGMIRYFLLMFPAFIVLAKIKNKYLFYALSAIYVCFIALLIFFVIRHVNGGFAFETAS